MIDFFLMLLAIGSIAGLLAGLLGVGGGLVLVPALLMVFEHQQVPVEMAMHLALGTSLASIVFTSLSSLRAHRQKGAVLDAVLCKMGPSIFVGTFLGSTLAARIPAQPLKVFFIVFATVVGLQMFLSLKPSPTRTLPGTFGMNTVGGIIGLISSFVGIGGGSLSVPFLVYSNIPMHQAIGTSAALGLPIALGGLVGYALNGLEAPIPLPYTVGFISLPALATIVLVSMPFAKVGAAWAHCLPVATLKRGFGVLLVLLAARMAWKVFF